jgi:hypothetical protein
MGVAAGLAGVAAGLAGTGKACCADAGSDPHKIADKAMPENNRFVEGFRMLSPVMPGCQR